MTPRDDILYGFFKGAVEESIERVKEALEVRGFVLDYVEYPRLARFESGFPSISTGGKALDYSNSYVYAGINAHRIEFGEIPAVKTLTDYCESRQEIWDYFRMAESEHPMSPPLARIGVQLMVTTAMNRFLHTHGRVEVTDERLMPIYLALEKPLFDATLEVDVLVPILLVHFDFDEFEVEESVRIRRLDDDEHRARFPRGWTRTSVNLTVLGAATHAFVLQGRSFSRSVLLDRGTPAGDAMYPMEEIDMLFDALRVVTGRVTGYAQVVLKPRGWAESFTAALPPLVHGPLVRAYPAAFENYGWLRKRASVTSPDIADLPTFLPQLRRKSKSVPLAARRFGSSSLRTRSEDALIDCCVALEALLMHDSRSEITQRLALRAAAVTGTSGMADPTFVFKTVKKIYDARSRVVHGSGPSGVDEMIDVEGRRYRASELARDVTRLVLSAILRDPSLRDPSYIDLELIVKRLTPGGGADRDPVLGAGSPGVAKGAR